MNTTLQAPTIKGIFVNSHIKAVRKAKGEQGIAKLKKYCPDLLHFKNSDDVLVRDEVRLLECSLQVMYEDRSFSKKELEYEAGCLHFTNFLTTPLAQILFPLFRTHFKRVMMRAKYVAGHVFQGLQFDSAEISSHAIEVSIKNNDYPLSHFQGFFQEWMDFSNHKGKVDAKVLADGTYIYTMRWK